MLGQELCRARMETRETLRLVMTGIQTRRGSEEETFAECRRQGRGQGRVGIRHQEGATLIIVAVRVTAASGQIHANLSLRARAETLALPRVQL